jgi:predicted nucleic acid-binding protein
MVDSALARLALDHTTLHYTHQNIAELWNAMTRPISRNGFGLTAGEVEREVRVIESGMSLLPDSAAVYNEWRRIIVEYGVSGIQVHDARLVAAMRVHGVGHILTLNAADFSRYSGIAVVHPSSL